MNPTVLVATTSCWYPAARLVMALHRAGCTVDAVCPKGHPLRKTKSIRQAHAYYGLSPLASFTRAIAISQPDLIVSGDDLATQHLQRLYAHEKRSWKREKKDADSAICALIERSFGDPESFPALSARATFMDLAGKEGVRVPATQVVRNLDEVKEWVGRMGLPAVLKSDGTSGGKGVRIVNTLDEAESAFEKLNSPPSLARAAKRALLDRDKTLVWPCLLRRRPVVNLQTFVAGREATSTIFCWQGRVQASLHFEVVKKTSSAGPSTVLRLIDNPEMSAAAEAMARRLRLSGLYGLDFMLEAESGKAYLIEINPRATQVGHLRLGPGRDIPAAFHAVLCDRAAARGDGAKAAVTDTERVTEKDTIALFPQEWIRDPESPFLRAAYHDIPWEEPDLVQHCVSSREKQSAWYRPKAAAPVASTPEPLGARAKSSSAGLGGQ